MEALDAGLQTKLGALRQYVRRFDGLAVAFSGGADSTLLAAVAQAELGDKALAVTAVSPLYPEGERQEAVALARRIGIRHTLVDSDELTLPGFAENPPNRCYLCKTGLFTAIAKLAADRGIGTVADGTNADDRGDYRPGRRAAAEQGVVSPLLEAGLTKADIRGLSRHLGLPTADKPALACLASRFPYGTRITPERLAAVEALEAAVHDLGFRQARVRYHGDVARIEVDPDAVSRLAEPDTRRAVLNAGRRAGFLYVAADLEGYRTGSLNAALRRSPAAGNDGLTT